MFIRLLSRGLFKRGSQADLGGRPQRERKTSNEDIKLLQPLTSDVGDEHPLDSMPEITTTLILSDTEEPDNKADGNTVVGDPLNTHESARPLVEINSFLMDMNVAGANATKEEDDADEVFQTPHLGPPFLQDTQIEHAYDVDVSSQATPAMLSDITEVEEPGSFAQNATPLRDLSCSRKLSYSSFGSSYPSSPDIRNMKTAFQTLPTAASMLAEIAIREAERAQSHLPKPIASRPEVRPLAVAPLLSSSSVDQLGNCEAVSDTGCVQEPKEGEDTEPKVEHRAGSNADNHPALITTTTNAHRMAISTFTDAPNLASQHCNLAADILRQPLSSAPAFSDPSNRPTPSQSYTPNAPPTSGTRSPQKIDIPHSDVRLDLAVAPEPTPERLNGVIAQLELRARARHALAKARDKGCEGTMGPAVSPRNEQFIGANAPSGVSPTIGAWEQQLHHRVDTWIAETPRASNASPIEMGLPATAPPVATQLESDRIPRRPTSVLNPHAPAWTPKARVRHLSASEIGSATPGTRPLSSPATGEPPIMVNADFDRLRELLRNCGIQDGELVDVSKNHSTAEPRSTPSADTHQSKVSIPKRDTEKKPEQRGISQATSVQGSSYGSNAAAPAFPGRVTRGFEFTCPTQFSPFANECQTSGTDRVSSRPQWFFPNPPHRPPLNRGNAQHFDKGPGNFLTHEGLPHPQMQMTPPSAVMFAQYSAVGLSGPVVFSAAPTTRVQPQNRPYGRPHHALSTGSPSPRMGAERRRESPASFPTASAHGPQQQMNVDTENSESAI